MYEPGIVMQGLLSSTAIVSILFLAENGTSIEVSSVGMEGVVGVPMVLSSHVAYRIVVKQSGPPGG